jgi:nicotinate-nucleotide adenylyltransferase
LVPVGIFGGTFNPVHFGHLRSAIELLELLRLRHLRMLPCAIPPHREPPGCSAAHRAAMVELAVASEPRLVCDQRELQRPGPSYTIDSLIELYNELGPGFSLSLVMGCDALLGLASWHRWRELLDWAHIVVIARPGWSLPDGGAVAQWLKEQERGSANTLRQRVAGTLIVEQLRPLAISATEIRALLQAGRSVRYLLPEPVLDYIHNHGLYRCKR